jgi:hypothetical protein
LYITRARVNAACNTLTGEPRVKMLDVDGGLFDSVEPTICQMRSQVAI